MPTATSSGNSDRRRLAETLTHLISITRSPTQLLQIHAQIITTSTTTPSLLSRLLVSLSLSSLPHAAALFKSIPTPTLPMYNAMIRALAGNPTTGHPTPLGLYTRLLSAGTRPDYLTFPFVIKHCSTLARAEPGESVHAHVLKLGSGSDVFVGNNLIGFYGSRGLSGCGRKVFEEMPDRDVVSWNSVLVGCLRCGELEEGLGLFRKMKVRSVVSWNSVITGLTRGGRAKEALGLFEEWLRSGYGSVQPDKITIASVVSACALLGALEQGEWVRGYLVRRGLEVDAAVGTALVDMYGKCGCVERAVEVFGGMGRKDVMAWTAMISALAVNGHGKQALALLPEMERCGLRPNYVTFGALLSACAHSGLLSEGWECFYVMKREYGIEPNEQHYACMVDLLGRAGLFEEAIGLIQRMPMRPDVYVLGALLGGCRMHGNVELGIELAEHLMELDPQNHAFYVTLSDIYAKAGRFNDAKRVRKFMEERGIRKTSAGCSMIEVNGIVYEFSVQGATDVALEEIMSILVEITEELKLVCYHSEFDEDMLKAN